MHRDLFECPAGQPQHLVRLDEEVREILAPRQLPDGGTHVHDGELGAAGVGDDDRVAVAPHLAERVPRPQGDAPRHAHAEGDARLHERAVRHLEDFDPVARRIGEIQLVLVGVEDRVRDLAAERQRERAPGHHHHRVDAATRRGSARRRAACRGRDDGARLRVGAVPGRGEVAGVASHHHALRERGERRQPEAELLRHVGQVGRPDVHAVELERRDPRERGRGVEHGIDAESDPRDRAGVDAAYRDGVGGLHARGDGVRHDRRCTVGRHRQDVDRHRGGRRDPTAARVHRETRDRERARREGGRHGQRIRVRRVLRQRADEYERVRGRRRRVAHRGPRSDDEPDALQAADLLPVDRHHDVSAGRRERRGRTGTGRDQHDGQGLHVRQENHDRRFREVPRFGAKKAVVPALDFATTVQTAPVFQPMKIIAHDRSVVRPTLRRH